MPSANEIPPEARDAAGYPADTHGEPEVSTEPDASEQPDAPSSGEEDTEGFWTQYGFASRLDWIRHQEEEQDRLSRQFGDGPLVGALQLLEGRVADPTPELPGDEVADVEPPPAFQRRTKQIGIKLKPHEHSLLVEAAGDYGVAPATLARMFVVRGCRAVAEARRGG